MVYNTEGRISSEDFKSLNKGIMSVGSIDSDSVVSEDKSNLKSSKATSNNNIVDRYIKTVLRSRKKSKMDLTSGKALDSREAK